MATSEDSRFVPAGVTTPMQNSSNAQPMEFTRPTFVWGVWALSLLAALAFVVRYAHNVPYYDDWVMTDVLANNQQVDAVWLWNQHNGHRNPLPKLVLIALYSLTQWDFRAGMYFNVVFLAALAAAAVKLAARQRGSVSYADAFFPLALLSWGHYENLLWSWQVTQVIPIGIAIALLLVIVRWAAQPGLRTALISATAVAALPLCGIAGLVFVPGFALWLLAVGWHLARSPQPKARAEAFAIWTIGAIAVALIPLYLSLIHI